MLALAVRSLLDQGAVGATVLPRHHGLALGRKADRRPVGPEDLDVSGPPAEQLAVEGLSR